MFLRAVRNYCATGKINGAFLTGKTWNISEDALVFIQHIFERGNEEEKSVFRLIIFRLQH